MSVVHKMIGYNKRTKKLELEFDLPGDDLEKVREITALPMDYEELLGAFPLPGCRCSSDGRRLRSEPEHRSL